MGEIKLAVRSLLKSKLFTAVAIITLVIGIGTTTAVFTVFSGVVLRPLPFPEQHRLVELEEWSATELCQGCGVGVSLPMLRDLEARLRSVEPIAAYSEVPVNIGGGDVPERASAARVSGNFFSVLGVRPAAGRGLDPTDDQVGAPPVVVLSDRLFQRRFGGNRGLIGQQIRLNGVLTTVVGVMSLDAVLPEFAELWMPLATGSISADREARDLGAIARLRTGFTVAAADAELKSIATDIARAHPETQKGWTGRVQGLRSSLVDNEGEVYGAMLGAVVLLWAIVCANLAGLLLSRGLGRRREIAVRLALGARRSSIVWHLLAESLCLAIVGGVLGTIAAAWTSGLLLASIDTQIPAWLEPRMDWRVMGFSALLSLVSVVAFGLLPAVRASRSSVHDDLKAGALASVTGAKSALRGSLVVVQLSLALVLLAAAGVLAATMERRSHRPSSATDGDVLQARIELLGDRTPERNAAVVTQLIERLAAHAGARSAAALERGFIAGFGQREVGIRAEGVIDVPPGVSPRFFLAVTPGYFETVGRPVVEGRGFTSADVRTSTPVVMINRRQATSLWPGRTALGRRIKLGAVDTLPWRTIVGIVADAGDPGAARSGNDAWVPFAQAPQASATILVSARGEPAGMVAPIREIARSVDADLPLMDVMTTDDAHAGAWRPYRAIGFTMSAFGMIALVLASVGLYGVVAYAAGQRTREIGLRIALGAGRQDVVRLVTRQGLGLIVIGLALGLAGALLVVPRAIGGLLFGASPFDPAVFFGASVLLTAVALAASYLPARRAARVDPMIALRSE